MQCATTPNRRRRTLPFSPTEITGTRLIGLQTHAQIKTTSTSISATWAGSRPTPAWLSEIKLFRHAWAMTHAMPVVIPPIQSLAWRSHYVQITGRSSLSDDRLASRIGPSGHG